MHTTRSVLAAPGQPSRNCILAPRKMSERVAIRYDGNCARGGRMRVATASTPFIPAAGWMAAKAVDLSRIAGRVSGVAAFSSSAPIPLRMISL
eukprot:6687878-Heterocapsa_arctica.AAC.1